MPTTKIYTVTVTVSGDDSAEATQSDALFAIFEQKVGDMVLTLGDTILNVDSVELPE
ncbi:MAG: hypothetical protein ABR951_10025 [Candidatus Aminicenantales bacterium]